MSLHHKEARELIKSMLEQEAKFEGHFNKCFGNLKKTQQEDLLRRVSNCKEKKENPIQSRAKKEIIGFVRKFGSNLRAIPAKEKKAYFLALFLDKHKYYEAEIIKLGF